MDQEDDAAWAAVHTPLSPDELIRFCHEDVERLFRINPYLEFSAWEALSESRYRFCGKNFSREQPIEFDLGLRIKKELDGLSVRYDNGLKMHTRFTIESSELGSRLTIHEQYRSLPAAELEARQQEVDRSLTTWAGDLQKYLIMWKQWRWLPPWRWYMRNVWQRLKPSGRRITYMFWWITIVEIALIALGAAIYLVEYS